MPRLIETDAEDAIEVEELCQILDEGGCDPRDEDGFASFGPALKRLANNRRFLADLVIEELKARCKGQVENQYPSQVILLPSRSDRYILRANFWPSASDSIVRNSGVDPFFYGIPHDHNFSFLTVGYLGPGYWSDYYEYDYASVTGVVGEEVALRFTERARLEEGRVMLYRAHRDVHNQLLPDAMSISLNILEVDYASGFRNQYRFDLENGRISGILNNTPLEPLLALSAHFGGGEGEDLLDRFSRHHPSDRVRWLAVEARASALDSLDARADLYRAATRDARAFVAGMAGRRLAEFERNRGWIEGTGRAEAAE